MFESILSPVKAPIKLPKYGLLYFDHLLGLHDVLAQKITDVADQKLLEEARKKRENGTLDWKDIYTFDLIILKYLDIGQLKSKLLTLRSQFRTIAGQKEYDAYLALKPPDPNATTDEKVLRQDLEYLLNEFYLRYSLTASREHLRSRLLKIAASFTFVFLVAGAGLIKINSSPDWATWLGFTQGVNTISVVIFAGIVGAFISMQQRIQSAPSEGDPIYNFSVLTHGVFGIFLSPITGAIFSVVLYLMFAAGVLQGSAFPKIITTPLPPAAATTPAAPATTTTPAAPATTTAPAAPATTTTPAAPATTTTPAAPATTTTPPAPAAKGPQPSPAAPGTPAAPVSTGAPAASAAARRPVLLETFSDETGPEKGVDYALLLIWAFIAGFAERLVPDALNKLVVKSEAAKVPTS